MEKKESKIKSNVATGMSSTAGAAIGVVAGSAISQSALAGEAPQPDPVPEPEPAPAPHRPEPAPQPQPTPPDPRPEPPTPPQPDPVPPVPEPEPQPTPVPPVPDPAPQPEVQVISYETVDNPDGSRMDVAVVSINGQVNLLGDTDMDGVADVIAYDANGNGVIEEDEIFTTYANDDNGNGVIEEHEVHPVSDAQIAMQPLQEAVDQTGDDIVCNDTVGAEPDYINDANVGEYIA